MFIAGGFLGRSSIQFLHSRKRRVRGAVLCGAAGLFALPGVGWAVVGVDYDAAADSIDNAVVLNDTVLASSLYNATVYSPILNGFTFTVPFNGDYGQGSVIAVVDLGLVDNTNPALTKASTFFNINLATNPSSTPPADLVGDHATAVATFAAGYNATTTDELVSLVDFGIAPLATLWSGSIVDSGDPNSDTGNTQTNASVLFPFVQAMQVGVNGTKADAVNASFGATDVPASQDFLSNAIDGLAAQNSHSTVVIAAGNSGPASGTVASPGVSFNGITVAALASDPTLAYQTASDYSSRGPQDFYNPVTGVTLSGVRPAVDLAAPGDYFVVSATPVDSVGDYELEIGAGTSFATPLVTGAVAQLTAYAHGLASLAGGIQSLDPKINQQVLDATDSRVMKAILLNSADKTDGWVNASMVNGVLTSTEGLDPTVGAGRLNVERAADNFLNGDFDPQVVGSAYVGPKGWDLSTVSTGQPNIYDLGQFTAGDTLSATLDWFADDSYDADAVAASINSFANLNLEVLEMVSPGDLQEIAISDTLYNNVQLLSFPVNDTADYEVEVSYMGVQFGTDTGSEEYALAWSNAAVPEPTGIAFVLPALMLLGRRRKLRNSNRLDAMLSEVC